MAYILLAGGFIFAGLTLVPLGYKCVYEPLTRNPDDDDRRLQDSGTYDIVSSHDDDQDLEGLNAGTFSQELNRTETNYNYVQISDNESSHFGSFNRAKYASTSASSPQTFNSNDGEAHIAIPMDSNDDNARNEINHFSNPNPNIEQDNLSYNINMGPKTMSNAPFYHHVPEQHTSIPKQNYHEAEISEEINFGKFIQQESLDSDQQEVQQEHIQSEEESESVISKFIQKESENDDIDIHKFAKYDDHRDENLQKSDNDALEDYEETVQTKELIERNNDSETIKNDTSIKDEKDVGDESDADISKFVEEEEEGKKIESEPNTEENDSNQSSLIIENEQTIQEDTEQQDSSDMSKLSKNEQIYQKVNEETQTAQNQQDNSNPENELDFSKFLESEKETSQEQNSMKQLGIEENAEDPQISTMEQHTQNDEKKQQSHTQFDEEHNIEEVTEGEITREENINEKSPLEEQNMQSEQADSSTSENINHVNKDVPLDDNTSDKTENQEIDINKFALNDKKNSQDQQKQQQQEEEEEEEEHKQKHQQQQKADTSNQKKKNKKKKNKKKN